ncbi:trypsin-like serine protease [Amycolatopsis mongoliensis]|uniref:Trypsin-like serine protease n=1 Tax=Amycolatopsis mongoliensis TaxID=715475 RepID=A0A9Y2JKM7_9PSEU|nr:trypsin-like serine protease [Amycolatopsis sp. 4-36]WIX99021.1 trypsin-like serine protease [Amycolatopsis sp. 4-36]
MRTTSDRRRRFRARAVAVAVLVGAGIAFANAAIGAPAGPALAAALGGHSLPDTTALGRDPAPAPPDSTKPAPSPILPFNAKLTSDDIPVQGGGVRDGACSGSLVAPQWVVTAGHCFHDIKDARIGGRPPYTMTVTVGRLKDSDPGGHTAVVVDVRQSPVNDLAVAKLSTPVDGITPVELASTRPAVGEELQFAGWGSHSATVLGPSDHLKRGRFRVSGIAQSTLEALPIGTRTVDNGPCPEDSGGPFFVSDDNDRTARLIAIVNTGPPCPQPGAETIARVDVVADWIREQTG